MTHLRLTPLFAFAVAMIAALPLSVQAADTKPSALIPKDSMIYFGIRNFDDFSKSVKKMAVWRMFEDPATKDMTKSWSKIGTKLKEYAAKKLNFESPKQLEIAPHGSVGVYLALAPPKEEYGEPEVFAALVMEMGEDAKKTRKVIDAIVQKSTDHGGKKDTRELAGGEIIRIRFETDSDVSEDMQAAKGAPLQETIDEIVDLIGDDLPGSIPKEALQGLLSEFQLPEEVVFAFRKDVAILASNQDTAAKVLRSLNSDGEGSYAQSKAVKELGRKLRKDGPIEMVIDIPRLVETFAKENEEVKSVISALGVDTFGPMLYVGEVLPESGIESRGSGFMRIGDKTKGLGKIFMMSNSKVTAPATVTSDAVGFATLNVNPAEMFEEIIDIATRIDPANGEAMRNGMIVPQPDGTTFDIRKDLIAHLVGPVIGSMSIEKPYAATNYNFFVSIGHKSREAWDKVLAMVPPGFLTTREMMGATVIDAALPINGVSMGLTDRSFVWLGTTNAVEGYIRREGRSEGGLAETPKFRRLTKLLPKQASGVIFFDGKEMFAAQAAASKAGYMQTEIPPMYGPAGGFLQWMIMQNFFGMGLENPDALMKYQKSGMAILTSEDDGIRFQQVEVVVEQDN